MNESLQPAPRVVTLTGTLHPKARIDRCSAAEGAATYSLLDANGNQVDSGGSISRFTPLAPLPPAQDAKPGDPRVYPEVSDTVLANAIANPVASPTPVPASVTQRQLRLHLLTLGVTDVEVRSQLSGNPTALIEWDYATEIKRTHPLVAQLASDLGLTSAQTDAAFVAAAKL